MDNLIDTMKVVHATNFAFYLKMHFFHWNVVGPNFSQDHAFFGDLYQEVHTAVDGIAEQIRAIQGYAPGSFQRFSETSAISDQVDVVSASEMYRIALADNNKLLTVLTNAYKLAESYGEYGLSNFLQARIEVHKKHGWMLRSISYSAMDTNIKTAAEEFTIDLSEKATKQ